jgi:uncharacterized protein YbjT (DUF2867 family)
MSERMSQRMSQRMNGQGGLTSRRALLLGGLALAGCTGPWSSSGPGTVLVAGGSGRAGRYVLAELAARGFRYRATTRSIAEARQRPGPAHAAGVDWVEADLRDAAAARRAVTGSDSVICVIGSRELSGDNSAEFVDYGAVRNLVDAASAEGARHFVLLTAIGVTDRNSPANKLFKGALEWRYKGEQHLRASGVPYTVVRPGGLVDEPAGRRGLRIAQGDDWKSFLRSTLSRADLAAVLVECLLAPGARNASFEIANDATLPAGGYREALARLKVDAGADAGADAKA